MDYYVREIPGTLTNHQYLAPENRIVDKEAMKRESEASL